MMNAISSMGSYQMMASGSKGPPPPKDQDVFQLSDSDGDGMVSATELESLTQKIEEVTGESIDVENALASFDTDTNGGLSGEELLEMLGSYGFTPPEMQGGGLEGEQAMQPPPPPPVEQALNSYSSNSGDDALSTLLELLGSSDAEESYSSIDISS